MFNSRVLLGALLILLLNGAAFTQVRTGQRGPAPLTQAVYDYAPQYSPDGKYIAFLRSNGLPPETPLHCFVSGKSVDTELWVMNADGTDARCLVSAENPFKLTATLQLQKIPHPASRRNKATEVTEFAWSPDSRSLVFVVQSYLPGSFEAPLRRSGPGVVNLHGECKLLTYHDAYFPIWSPDSRNIAFVNPGGYLYVADSEGKAVKELADDHRVILAPIAWTPDQQRLLCCRQLDRSSVTDIFAITLATGAQQNLTNTPDQYESWLALSPDGTTLAYTLDVPNSGDSHLISQRYGVYLATLADFHPRKVLEQPVTGLHWLPDSKALQVQLFSPLYSESEMGMHVLPKRESVPQVMVIDADGHSRFHASVEHSDPFSFAPDNLHYVYAAGGRI